MAELVRIQKALADAGLASRRAADALVAAGRVSVNGRTAVTGQRVDPSVDSMAVDGRPVLPPSHRTYLVLHKPAGVTSTVSDRHAERTVLDLVPPDMRAGAAFNEDYSATSGPMIAYRKAVGWNPLGPSEQPSDLRSFFQQLKETDGPHGGRFWYVSPNTDLLGWVMERVSGRRYAHLVSELLWRPVGAAENAYITVDRLGAPRAAGGMCAATRDLARVGQMLVEGGSHAGRQVVPSSWIEMIINDGDPRAWEAGNLAFYYPGIPMHYRAKWYVERRKSPLLFCLGIHGQNLFVDAEKEIVIAKFSSQAQPLNVEHIGLTGNLVATLRQTLAGG
jgi:CubicO group peptidase (beta-lactamase class C family)